MIEAKIIPNTETNNVFNRPTINTSPKVEVLSLYSIKCLADAKASNVI